MKIKKTDINILVGDPSSAREGHKSVRINSNKKASNIFAGNLKLPNDNIAQKKKEAMKKAIKIVGEAFSSERKIDDDIERRLKDIENLKNKIHDSQQAISKIDASKKEIKEVYGITDSSQEQQDLLLLEKRRDAWKDPSLKLSDEDNQRLAIIDKMGMTEYQRYSLEIDALKEPFQKIIDDSQNTIINENMTIIGIKLERLKTHPMVDANAAADKLLDAASEEILGMLIEEAKDYIDEEMEEKKEAADKKAEEEEKREDKTEAIKEKAKQMEAVANKGGASSGEKAASVHKESKADNDIMEQILDLNEIEKNVQKEVQEIINEMKLLSEDIIGAVVDTSI